MKPRRRRRASSPLDLSDWDYTDDADPWRHLAMAMLIGGCLGALDGQPDDVAWVQSSAARLMAELVELRAWPPRPEHMAQLRQLASVASIRSGVLRRQRRKATDDMVADILDDSGELRAAEKR